MSNGSAICSETGRSSSRGLGRFAPLLAVEAFVGGSWKPPFIYVLVSDRRVASLSAKQLTTDAQTFASTVNVDVQSLVSQARQLGFDLVIFTNTLARKRQFLLVTNGAESHISLSLKLSTSPPTAYSPLSLRDNFAAALDQVAVILPGSKDVTLVVNSHGTKNFAIIPRLATDFTSRPPSWWSKRLKDAQGDDLAIEPLRLEGISKTDFWLTLGEVSERHKLTFSTVVLDACESGISTWDQLWAIPPTIGAIIDTGLGSTHPGQIDYARLSSFMKPSNGLSLTYAMTGLLADYGFERSRPGWRWRLPLIMTLTAIPWELYLLPLMVWLARYRPFGSGTRRLVVRLCRSTGGLLSSFRAHRSTE